MQYYYAYIMRLKRRPNLPMSVGSGGHQALEYNGRHKINTGLDLPPRELIDVASMFIDQHTEELETSDLKGANKGEAKDKALAAIHVYRVRDAEKVIPAGVEVEFNLDFNEPNEEPIRIINGKIDLITTKFDVIDYKFAGQMKSQGEVDTSPQLTLYGKVVKSLTGQYAKRTGLQVFLAGSSKTPPDSKAIYRDPAMMAPEAQERRFARLAHQFRMAEKGIRLGMFMPADDPKTCSWCGYRDQCQYSLVSEYEAIKLRGEQT
jgi:CRISPR/Cas system-associated exonuclease Cas4 (RecB family)